MRRITLSNEIKRYHREYFKKNILPNFSKTMVHITFSSITDERAHRKFMKFCSHKYNQLAIGKTKELEQVYKIIKKNHNHIIHMIKNYTQCNYKEKVIKYNDLLMEIFGYNQFQTSSIFDYIKNQAVRKTGESRYNLKVQHEIIDIFIDIYPGKKDDILKYKNSYLHVDDLKKEIEKIICTDITLENFKSHNLFTEEWSPYTFIFMMGLRVCPYCNRQYITPVYSQNGSLRPDLDHLLPKCKYPFFSMSIYNLVPSCKFCNSSLKGTKDFDFNILNPYEDNIDDYIKFQVDITNNFGDINIKSAYKNDEKTENYKDLFKIQTLYNYHKDQAKSLIKKRLSYSEEYIHDLYIKNKQYYKCIDEVKETIIGYTASEHKINAEPLSKFKRDIVKQLGFNNEDNDEDLIKQLQKILKKI